MDSASAARWAIRRRRGLGIVIALAVCGSVSMRDAGAQLLLRDGQAGFVVSHIEYALSHDAEQTGACPDGMTQGYASMGDVFLSQSRSLPRSEGEDEDDYRRRLFRQAFEDPASKNLCLHPELGSPDPTFRTVSGPNVPVHGMDLDGHDSKADEPPAPGTCPHVDFAGMNGERGVDNQFFRVVGCSNSFQSTGQSNTYAIEMLTGSWGILITLSGVDDLRNDDSVEVGIHANGDPIELGPNREPLRHATYAIDQDPRFRATATGRIEDGVLTTEPVDLRFRKVTNDLRLERPLREARLRMTIGEDGSLSGILGGYTPVEEAYDMQYGMRDGLDGTGRLAPLRRRMITSIGQARVLGHTCHGAWFALHEHADAHRDPVTGQCTSISTQYRLEAIPAFVVDVETESVNEALDS